jgi:hypothetical protein
MNNIRMRPAWQAMNRVAVTLSTRPAGLAATAGLLLAAVAPLVIPAAILSPNLVIVRRIELTLTPGPSGVLATERRWGLFGPTEPQSYGPILAAYPDFIRVVQSASEPQRNEVLSVMALRAPDGVHHPFADLNATAQPIALKTVTGDVSAMAEEIQRFLQRQPTPPPLSFARSQPYPLFLYTYDAAGVLLALAIARYWSFSLCRAALLRLRAVPADRAAAPVLDILERIVTLVAWLAKRER